MHTNTYSCTDKHTLHMHTDRYTYIPTYTYIHKRDRHAWNTVILLPTELDIFSTEYLKKDIFIEYCLSGSTAIPNWNKCYVISNTVDVMSGVLFLTMSKILFSTAQNLQGQFSVTLTVTKQSFTEYVHPSRLVYFVQLCVAFCTSHTVQSNIMLTSI